MEPALYQYKSTIRETLNTHFLHQAIQAWGEKSSCLIRLNRFFTLRSDRS